MAYLKSHRLSLIQFVVLMLSLAESRVEAQARLADPDPSSAFFEQGVVPRIHLAVEGASLEELKKEPRNYVKAKLREDGRDVLTDVGIKLKGAAGSFRDWDDRPALTLNVRKFVKAGSFHGLVKFHLNNSVQDDTYLSELLCSDLFRRSGVPAPRVTHARVWLNGRDVGLYVLKEGFDEPFLKRWFPDAKGNLYDGGFLQDVNAQLEKDEGKGPDDRSDLKAVVDAATDPDPASRWKRLGEVVDMDRFITFMALERMTCHWDGYVNQTNNYRVYFDPSKKKAVFLPHGMDQMFGETGMTLFDQPRSLVGGSVIQSDAYRKRYRQRLRELLPLMSPADSMIAKVDEATRRLQPVLAEIRPDLATEHAQRVADLKARLVARAENLRQQVDGPDEPLMEFDEQGKIRVNSGWGHTEPEQPGVEFSEATQPFPSLRIKIPKGSPTAASWRHLFFLGPGRYRFQAEVRTDRAVAHPEPGPSGAGLGFADQELQAPVTGSVARQAIEFRFEVREDRRLVELMLELRAASGEVWFDLDSLKLVREPLP